MYSFQDFLKEHVINQINESSDVDYVHDDATFGRAATLVGSLVNKKTGKDFKMFPFFTYCVINGEDKRGVLYVSNKDDSSFRVTAGSGNTPGLIGSLDYFKDFSSGVADFTVTSDTFPIVKLINEFVRLINEPSYIKQVSESIETENLLEAKAPDLTSEQMAEIEQRLSSGEPAAKICKEMGVSYGKILSVKRNVSSPEAKTQPVEHKNTMTLNDKVKYLDELLEDVYEIARRVGAGAFNSLFISGRAGTGKTYSVEKGLKDEGLQEDVDYFKVSGSISTIEMFKKLYQFKDKLLVIDDCDSVFRDESGRNILKAALDTKKVRRISYLKKMKMLFDPKDYENDPEGMYNEIESGNVPKYFDFMGQVIFISNLKKDVADPDGAIRSRSILIDINPDDATLMERMRVLLPDLEPKELSIKEKEEIFDFMKDSKSVSMRTFVKAAGFKMSGLREWKRMAQRYV